MRCEGLGGGSGTPHRPGHTLQPQHMPLSASLHHVAQKAQTLLTHPLGTVRHVGRTLVCSLTAAQAGSARRGPPL